MKCECGDPKSHSGHCGCCGEPIPYGEWCAVCMEHLLPEKPGLAPWDRTWFAQHGTDCPNEGPDTSDIYDPELEGWKEVRNTRVTEGGESK